MTEAEFSTELGVSAELVSSLRKKHLVEPEHFTREPKITFTPAGMDLLMDYLGAEQTDMELPKTAVLRVNKTVQNVAIVIAEAVEKKIAGPLTLKVPFYTQGGRAMSHFRAGQTVRARHIEGATWAYEGPKPQSPRDPKAFLNSVNADKPTP